MTVQESIRKKPIGKLLLSELPSDPVEPTIGEIWLDGRVICEQESSATHHKVRLVIVDDHSVVRRGAVSWLSSQHCFQVVGEAAKARDALALAINKKPDVVLLDVLLEDECGLTVAQKIFRACPTTQIIAFSASADSIHVRGMIAAGAKAYVLKTSDLSVLLTAINKVCRGERFLDPGLSNLIVEELGLFPTRHHRSRDVLTARQREVLECMVWGYSNKEIAAELKIRTTTVNTHRVRICERLGLSGRGELVRYAIAAGLTTSRTGIKKPPNAARTAPPATDFSTDFNPQAC